MATALFESLRHISTDKVVSLVSEAVGESPTAVAAGLTMANTRLLNAMSDRAADRQVMSELFAIARDPAARAGNETTEGRVARSSKSVSTLRSLGGRFELLLLGERVDTVIDLVAAEAGLKRRTAASLVRIAATMILSEVARIIQRDLLDSSELARRCGSAPWTIDVGGHGPLHWWGVLAQSSRLSGLPVGADGYTFPAESRFRAWPPRWPVPKFLTMTALTRRSSGTHGAHKLPGRPRTTTK